MALILSVNAGSSSLKLSLYSQAVAGRDELNLVLTSSFSSISSPPAKFSFGSDITNETVDSIQNHASAFEYFLEKLQLKGSIDSTRIKYICHRIVHGGDYTQPVEINQESYHHIEQLSDLAPLWDCCTPVPWLIDWISPRHNGAALSVVKACLHSLPNAKSVAYFDTTFHTTIPRHISTYAINQAIARQKGLKKYGFHGLSCTSSPSFQLFDSWQRKTKQTPSSFVLFPNSSIRFVPFNYYLKFRLNYTACFIAISDNTSSRIGRVGMCCSQWSISRHFNGSHACTWASWCHAIWFNRSFSHIPLHQQCG